VIVLSDEIMSKIMGFFYVDLVDRTSASAGPSVAKSDCRNIPSMYHRLCGSPVEKIATLQEKSNIPQGVRVTAGVISGK
jgi:hypothetical protein